MATILGSKSPQFPASFLKSQTINNESFSEVASEDFLSGVKKTENAAQVQSSFLGSATAVGDVLADVSWLMRVLIPESPAAQLIGMTTAENAFRGLAAAVRAWKRFTQAQEISDKGGMLEAGIDVARGTFQCGGGACYGVYRWLATVADIKNVNIAFNATTALGKAAYIVSTLGNALFTLFYVAIGVWCGYSLYKIQEFMKGLNTCGTDAEMAAFFRKKAIGTNLAQKLDKKYTTDEQILAAKEGFAKNALDTLTDLLYSHAIKEDPNLTKEDLRRFLQGKLGPQNTDKNTLRGLMKQMGLEQVNQKWDFSYLELIGFSLEEMKRQKRKDARLARTAGSTAPAIKKAFERGLSERLASPSGVVKQAAHEELSALQGRVRVENAKNSVLFGLFIASAVFGLATSILGFLPALSVGCGIALTVITLVLCVSMLLADFQSMKEGLGSGEPGRYDKHYVVFLACMILSTLAISIGVTLGFGLPILPLIFVSIFSLVGVGLCGVAFDELSYKETKWKWEHPDLETIHNLLSEGDNSAIDERLMQRFKYLSKQDRELIRNKYFEMKDKLGFKNSDYSQLNAGYNFGEEYFFSCIKEGSSDQEHALLIRGLKKSCNFFWKKRAQEKSKESREIALQMQDLFEQAQNLKKVGSLEKARKKLSKAYFLLKVSHKAAHSRLLQDLWYVAKRQENKSDLKTVVKAVLLDTRPLQAG